MNANEWINLDRTVTSSKRYYAHFDLRTDIGQQKEYILSADKAAAHNFYPFIHYKKNMTKLQTIYMTQVLKMVLCKNFLRRRKNIRRALI